MVKHIFLLLLSFFIFATTSFASNNPTPSRIKNSIQTRLNAAGLKSCQAREGALVKQMTQLNQMSTNMISSFDKIATRLKNYYINTAVPSGKTISNYSALVADIESKKAEVLLALTKAQSSGESFACSGDDPKGSLTGYRTNMMEVKSALKNYRTSINTLITSVRSASPNTTISK